MSFLFKEFAAVKTQVLVLVFGVLCAFNLVAGVNIYKETENEGMDRYERFANIEKYLIEIGNSLNKLESRIESNAGAVKALELKVEAFQAAETKKSELKVKAEEKTLDGKKIEEEMKKLKEDFISIKNKDIESMKTEIYDLKISQKILEGKVR